MSKSINQALLLGNIGSEPEVRDAGGTKCATFSLATSKSWTDAKGEKQERTQWHRCVAWNNKKGNGLADIVEKYVSKGDKILVQGEIEYRQYEKDGQTKYTTEIRVSDLTLLGGNKGDAGAPEKKPVAKVVKGKDADFDVKSLEDDDDLLPF